LIRQRVILIICQCYYSDSEAAGQKVGI